ncbi:glycerol-3-phosphate O-acyltransferase [Spirochaetia bacterium]|nr:glycerol-3-phosphate O-acyltransferase [Spirochaetia bacterium]
MDTLVSLFGDMIKQAMSLTKTAKVITEHNVYQEGETEILPCLDKMVEGLALPGSALDGLENLEELLAKAESGKSCLLLLEHYSNMDLTTFSYFVRKAGGRGADIANAVVAIAGMKLTEENPTVAALASAYTRLVIYPSRSLQGLNGEKAHDEIIRSNAINRAAMKVLNEIKLRGKLILVFPSGTRYRAWDPSTKKGVREIDSYLRSFDYLCPVAMNGNLLRVSEEGGMEDDPAVRDIVRITAGPVLDCAEFREKARAEAEARMALPGQEGIEDKKQAAVDAVMARLEEMHIAAEEKRQKLLNQ